MWRHNSSVHDCMPAFQVCLCCRRASIFLQTDNSLCVLVLPNIKYTVKSCPFSVKFSMSSSFLLNFTMQSVWSDFISFWCFSRTSDITCNCVTCYRRWNDEKVWSKTWCSFSLVVTDCIPKLIWPTQGFKGVQYPWALFCEDFVHFLKKKKNSKKKKN